MQSIEMCVARFDEDTKTSFMDLYTKIDAGISMEEETSNPLLDGMEEEEPAF